MKFGLRAALLLLAVLLLSVTLAYGGPRCDLCGGAISGKYYQSASGRTYCGDCWAKYKVCAQCGELTKSWVTVDGRNFCSSCYSKLDKCSLCGQTLTPSYTSYPDINLRVCQKCEREKPRCQRCNIPVNNPVMIGKVALCESCASQVELCHSCGQPLLSDYSFFEGNKQFKYCFDCTKAYPGCADCGAPSGPDGTQLADGRYLCHECRKVAFFDSGFVTPIRARVLSFLNNHMGMTISHIVNYSLQDRAFLAEKARGSHGDLNGLFYRKGNNFNVYVLYGLREKDLICVLAHEMTHAWQAENCSDNIQLDDQEGFAQWVAYKALKQYDYGDFAGLLISGENPYATGLAKMLQIEKTGGPKAVFDYIKSK